MSSTRVTAVYTGAAPARVQQQYVYTQLYLANLPAYQVMGFRGALHRPDFVSRTDDPTHVSMQNLPSLPSLETIVLECTQTKFRY